jgi:hypothetical protein
MNELKKHIKDTIGVEIEMKALSQKKHAILPMFINEFYQLAEIKVFNSDFILAERANFGDLSIAQTEKHFKIITELLNAKVVLLVKTINSFSRKRLIEKGINFIVPGKQLFLPSILIDLNETGINKRDMGRREKLIPSAQLILLYRILHRDKRQNIEELSFKQLAQVLNYTPMVITNAVNNLKYHEICTSVGGKEKFIRFNLGIQGMWHDVVKRDLFVIPVLKEIYTDEVPKKVKIVRSNLSALPDYSDMNPGNQNYFAIEKNLFYSIQNGNNPMIVNKQEGSICLELWKYDPALIMDQLPHKNTVIDPLSLYLSLKNSSDERIQDALEQIIEKYIW